MRARRAGALALALLVLAAALGAGLLLAEQAAHRCGGDEACPVCGGLRLAAQLVRLLAAAGVAGAAALTLAGRAAAESGTRPRTGHAGATPVERRVRMND